jgi:hypothetical protein
LGKQIHAVLGPQVGPSEVMDTVLNKKLGESKIIIKGVFSMIKLKFLLKSIMGVSLFSAILFLSAGRINFIQGWIYYFVSIFGLLINIFLIRNNEQLIKGRTNLASNTVIMLQLLVRNLQQRLWVLLSSFFKVRFFIDTNEISFAKWIMLEL